MMLKMGDRVILFMLGVVKKKKKTRVPHYALFTSRTVWRRCCSLGMPAARW